MSLPTYAESSRALATLRRRNVTILGFGAAGAAHARCLRDSGVDLRIGLAADHPEVETAQAEGFVVLDPYEACEESDLICLLEPPQRQAEVFEIALADNLIRGDALLVSDGFALRYGFIEVPAGVDVALVTPLGPPELVRREYAQGRGVPMLVALAEDPSGTCWDLALGYAAALGGTRAGIVTTTVAEAVDARNVGLAVGASAIPRVMRASFDRLVRAGYSADVAYLACIHEVLTTVEEIHRCGIDGMRAAREPWEAMVAAAADADPDHLLDHLLDGTLARDFVAGVGVKPVPPFDGDTAGERLRALMPWLRDVKGDDGERWH